MEKPDYHIRPDVMTYDDIVRISPIAEGHRRSINWGLRIFGIEKINAAHRRLHHQPGPECFHRFLLEDLDIRLRIDNERILDRLPAGAFITISNHPFGAIDGITLIHLITYRRPEFRMMVDRSLAQITAMRPNFITVDAVASDNPEKRKISYSGLREVIQQLNSGAPVGFFPAGAVSRTDRRWRLNDRPWRLSVIRIIRKAGVPVIPIFFHGSNSMLFNLLSHTKWPSSTFMMPIELWRKKSKEIHLSVGDVISPQEIAENSSSVEMLSDFLREKTYRLRTIYK